MKLSMSLLAKQLVKYDPEIHILHDTLSIGGVRFLSEHHTASTLGYVYVGNASLYFQDKKYEDAMILVCGRNQIICHSSDLELLLNDILAAFDLYAGAEERLIRGAVQHESLQELLPAAAEIVESPILLFDMEGFLICASHEEALPPSMQESLHSSRTIGVETISQVLVDEQGQVWHDITDVPKLLYPKDNKQERAVSMYLRSEDERVGYMMIFPQSANEERIALHCEKMLAGYLCQAKEFTDDASVYLAGPQILRQLLAGQQPADMAVRRFLNELEQEPFQILMVLQSIGARNYTVYHMMISELKKTGMRCTICEYQNMIAILGTHKGQEQILKLLRQKKWMDNLAVGISMPVHHVSELPVAYAQARFAVSVSEESGVRKSEDYALEYLLRLLRENEMSVRLRHPAITVLENYDAVHHTDLLLTLEMYLQRNCNKVETAEAMHIHLNSLKYRLRRICELTGLDMHDHEDLFYLQLSMRL